MNVADELVRDYLARLSELADRWHPEDRDELVGQMADHIDTARTTEGHGEAATRNVLERLGTPEEIIGADECHPAVGPRAPETTLARDAPPPRLRWQEIAALVLLPLGGFLFLVGWIVGVVLLWTSDRWRPAEKVLATLVWPFGYLPVAYSALIPVGGGACGARSGGPTTCTSFGPPVWLGIATFAVLVLAPCVVLTLLARRAGPGRG